MLVYYFVPFIVSNRYLLFWVSNGHNSVTVQIRTHGYMNFFDHKGLGNHLLQLCPKVVKQPVYRLLLVLTQRDVLYQNHRILDREKQNAAACGSIQMPSAVLDERQKEISGDIHNFILRPFTKFRKSKVRPSAWNTSGSTVWIFIAFKTLSKIRRYSWSFSIIWQEK